MAGISSSSDDDVVSGINVTPLVDVVLVLLVIFMMTAPAIYQSAIQVQLPKAKSGDQSAQQSPLQLSISSEGQIYWDKTKLTFEELSQKLTQLENPGEKSAILAADEKVPHGQVVKVMDALRRAGVHKFALSVDGASP
jgi:biopolymer transport protein ExbD